MSQSAAKPDVSPALVMQYTWGFALTEVLKTAVDLDLFTKMADRSHTAAELASATGTNERGLCMLLNALAGMQLVSKHDNRYSATEVSRVFLSREAGSYLGAVVSHRDQIGKAWAKLTDVVRTGVPPIAVHEEQDGAEFFSAFVDALWAMNEAMSVAVAKHVAGQRSGVHILDVGAGSGVWGIAFLRQDSQAQLTIADFPGVIDQVTKTFVDRFDAANRVSYLPGDFHDVEFGEAKYDVVTIGHIFHSEGERGTKELLSRSFRALKPGGKLVVAEFIADESRSRDLMPLLFAVNMLVHTRDGDTFTWNELERWTRESGFTEVEQVHGPAPSPLLVATKP